MPIEKVSKAGKASTVSTGKSSPASDEPRTMEELLKTTDYQFQGLKRGMTVVGKISQISAKALFVDIGAKTEGVIAEREFDLARDYIKGLKMGEEISCEVFNPESESGQILLSLRKTAFLSGWRQLAKAKEKKEEIEVLVTDVGRNGLTVEIYGLDGFVPNSQIGNQLLGKMADLAGKRIKVKVVEIEEKERRLIFSEKAVSEKDKIEAVKKAIKKVKMGEEYEGVVTGLTPFGVFVQINLGKVPVEGLVHISELSWEKVEDPNQVLKVGEEARIKVIGVDQEEGRLAFSLKQLTPDPWFNLAAKYPPETHLKGKISRLTAYGAFVEVEPGIMGLLHISKIPAEKRIEVGEEVACFVEAVEPEKRRLSLGLALKEKPVGYK